MTGILCPTGRAGGELTGRCSDQQRSRRVKLFHYNRTRSGIYPQASPPRRERVWGHWRKILNPWGKQPTTNHSMFLSLLVTIQQRFQPNPENIMAFNTWMAVAGEYEKSINDLTLGQLRIRLVFRQCSLPRKTHYIPLEKAVIATEACNSLNNLTWSDLSDCSLWSWVVSDYIKSDCMAAHSNRT